MVGILELEGLLDRSGAAGDCPGMMTDHSRPVRASTDGEHHLYLTERAGWLVRTRWVAVGATIVAAGLWPLPGQARGALLGCAAALGLANAVFAIEVSRLATSMRNVENCIFRQLLFDLGALGLVLHFSGGGENPFAMLYPLPMALGATLLRSGQAAALGIVGTTLHVSVVLGELTGVLTHHSLDSDVVHGEVINELFSSSRFVGAYLTAFALMNFGVVYLARSVTARFHHAEARRREHERVAQSRARLARIGEIAAGVAHSVRNPVHGLVNAVNLLSSRNADPIAAETLSLMNEALGRIELVTRRLLSLGREAVLRRGSCDVDQLVEDALQMSAPQARGSLATLSFAPGAAGEAQLDSVRVGEAIANVVDNAVDACRTGGQVSVRTRGSQATVVVEVVDRGVGIRPEHLGQIFDPFFTTKPVGQGTGLGLAIARRVVEEHGGTIAVESTVGQGTAVRLELPRRLREGVAQMRGAQA